MARPSSKAPDHDSPYRAFCEAAGWRFYKDSDVLRAWTGETFGIAHAATVEGRDHHSDAVYDTWEACHDDWVGHPETPKPSTAVN